MPKKAGRLRSVGPRPSLRGTGEAPRNPPSTEAQHEGPGHLVDRGLCGCCGAGRVAVAGRRGPTLVGGLVGRWGLRPRVAVGRRTVGVLRRWGGARPPGADSATTLMPPDQASSTGSTSRPPAPPPGSLLVAGRRLTAPLALWACSSPTWTDLAFRDLPHVGRRDPMAGRLVPRHSMCLWPIWVKSTLGDTDRPALGVDSEASIGSSWGVSHPRTRDRGWLATLLGPLLGCLLSQGHRRAPARMPGRSAFIGLVVDRGVSGCRVTAPDLPSTRHNFTTSLERFRCRTAPIENRSGGGAFRHLLSISLFALVIATSTGAYAAVTIAPKNSVVSKSIKNQNVKTSDLARFGRQHQEAQGRLRQGCKDR